MKEQRIKVSIVEDNARITETLKGQISKTEDLVCISDYNLAEDALKGLIKDNPQIVLMDIGMPCMSGIECMFRVKLKCPNINFLMFTVLENDEKVFDALKSGASGYVLKRDGITGVIAAIRELNQGGAPMSREIAQKVINSFHLHGPKNTLRENLTPREIEILKWLAKGLQNKEVAEKMVPPIAEGTVKQHIHRIYRKLQVNNRTEAVNKYLGNI